MKIGLGDDSPRSKGRLRAVTGAWLHSLAAWTWWGSFTFKTPVTKEYAARIFRRFMTCIAKDLVGQHCPVAWTIEPAGGSWHIHALLSIPDSAVVNAKTLHSLWMLAGYGKTGFTDIRGYDPKRGAAAAEYTAKTPNWDYNVACPRRPGCRRNGTGCIEAPGPWR